MRECGSYNRDQMIDYIMEKLTPQNIGFILAMLDRPEDEWEQMAREYMETRASR